MKTKLDEFRIYAPPDVKSYGLNEDGTLTITGIASTTNEDLDGDIVSPNALESLAQQVIGLNLHLDHNHHYDGGIGVIKDAELENSSLRITAVILPEFAEGILERLSLGMNFGFSIGGIPVINSMNSNVINDFILLEVSLTLLPANWDTFGTVETKGLVESKCLTGACHYILKEKRSNTMSKKDLKEPIEVSDELRQEFVNIVNEAVYNLKPQLVEDIRGEVSGIIREVVTELLPELLPTETKEAEDEIIEEECIEEFDVDENIEEETDAVEEVTAEPPIEEEVEEEEVVEVKAETEPEEAEEDEAETETEEAESEDEIVEEEKDAADGQKEPVVEEPPLEKEEEEEEDEPAAATENVPKVIVDVKELKDEILKDIKANLYDEMVKEFNLKKFQPVKKSTKTKSKLDQYKKSQSAHKKNSSFLGSDERDEYGRNRKYL